MRSNNVLLQTEAGRMIANLCHSQEDFVRIIIDSGGQNLLLAYALSSTVHLQKVGILGLFNLSAQSRFHSIMMKCGLLEALIALIRTDNISSYVQRYTLNTISSKWQVAFCP
jgi:hypothetical protein